MSYWQLRCAEMKQRSAYLYRSGLWSDCSFKLGEEEVIVKAHKLIMAMASPVFGKLFYGREAAKSPVPIYDTRPDVFRMLLEYIYSDDITLTNLRDACDLHNAAFKWGLPYVKEMCIKFISSSLNADNVCCIYELACQSKEFHLQDDCIKIFKTLTKEILKAESFKEAKLSTVLKIFSMDTLNIDSELDLFKAAVNHAAAQEVEDEGLKRTHSEDCYTPSEGPSCAKRSRIDSTELESAVEMETNNDTTSDSSPAVNLNAGSSRQESHHVSEHDYAGEGSTEHGMTTESYIDYEEKLLKAKVKATRREKYRDLIRKIRFLTLTPQEFAECTTLSFLLPSSAVLALSLNISSKDTFVPMPKHFSTSMVPRNLQNERERQAVTTRITVNNIRNLKKFESNPFYTRNLAWTLMLMHLQETVEEINRDILIIAVTCFFEMGVPEWIEKVEVRVSFVSENYSNTFQDMKLKLSEPCNDYGAWIIKKEWSDLISAYGIIEDNTVTCKVHVSTNIQKSPTSPDSSPDSTQTDYITTPLRSSTPVSRARYLKDKTRKRSDLTASELTGTRSRPSPLPEKRSSTPLLPEKRSLTPLLPEKRSLTPLLPEKRSLTPLLPENRSLTPLMPEKRSLTPLLPEKRSLTPLLPKKRSLTPLMPENRSLTPLLPEKRSLTPLLPEKRSLTPLLPEKRSLTPLLPEKRSLTPLLPEKRSLTPLLSEKCSVPSPMTEKRSLTPLLPEKRCLTPQLPEKSNQSVLSDHSLTPVLTDKRLPPVHPEKRSGSPLIEKHGVTKTPAKRHNLSPLPEERNITPPPVENRILPPRPKKRYLTRSPTEKLTESPEKRRLSSSPLETSNLPIKNGANSSPLPLKNNATPSLPKKHASTPTSSPINTKSPLSTQANLTKSIPAPISSPSLSEEVIIPKQTGKTVCSPQTVNSPVVGPINLNSSDPSIETLKLSVSNKDKPRALTCVQILRSLHRKGYPMNGSIAQKYLNELSAMSINGFQVLRPLLAYANASAATNGSGHIVPAIMDKKREVLSPINDANSALRSIDDNNTKSVTKPDQKENEPLISEPIPRKDNVSSVSESMAIPDDITVLSNPSAVANCSDSINEQNVKQLAIKPPALKDDRPLISEPIGTKDTVFSMLEPIALTDDVKVISNPSALMDGADSIKEKGMKQLAPKPLALKDDGPSVSEPSPIRDTVSSVSEPMEVTDDVKAMSSPSPLTDSPDSIHENNIEQFALEPHALEHNGPFTSEPIHMKDTVSSISEPMSITENITAISNPSALIDCTDSINDNNMKQQGPISIKDTNSSLSEPMAITDDITRISNSSALIDCTDSINENNMKQQEPIPIRDTSYSVLEPMLITDDITRISSPSSLKDCTDSSNEQDIQQLSSIPHDQKHNEPTVSEPIPIKDSSVIEPLTTIDDSNSAFKQSIIVASSNLDPLPLKSKVSIYETNTGQVHPKSTVPVITEPMPLNNDVSLSEPLVLNDDTSVAVFAGETNKEQFEPYPSTLNDNEPLYLESMCLKEADKTNSVSELSSNKNSLNIMEKSEAESLIMDGTNMVLEQSADDKNREQTTLKTLALQATPFVSDPNLKENIPTVPQSLESSVDDESVLKLTASNNNSSSISDSMILKYDDSGTSEIIDLINSADSSLKRDSIEHPLDVKKDNASTNSKALAEHISPEAKPVDLMESVDIHPENHQAQLALDDTEPSNSEPLALNDTIILEAKPVAVPLVSNPLVLNDNLSSASKPMDLMEIYDTISELHIAEAQMTLGETEPLESEPLVLNDTILLEPKPAEVPLVSNPLALNDDSLSSASKPMDLMEIYDTISELHIAKAQMTLGETEPSKSIPFTLNDTILLEPKPAEVPLVSDPLVLNNNLSSASKPMDLMEIYDTISELHIAEAKMTLGETEPSKSISLTVNDTIILEAQPVAVPLVSDPLVLNNNLPSASKPMDLMEIYDTISELHIAEAQMTLGETEPLKSEPLTLNDTILLEPKPAEVPFVSNPLVLNHNLSSASKTMDLMEIYDTISELHTLEAQMTLCETEPSKTEPLALNDTIILEAKSVAVTLVSNPLVLNHNISSASKTMDLMEIYDTISELHTLEAQMTLGETEPSKSEPLALNDSIILEAEPVAVTLVSDPLVLNDNLSSASKQIDLMDIYDTISELHTLEAQLPLGDTEVSKSQPLALNDTILLEPKPAEVPFVSNPLVLNDNLSSASKPMKLMEIYDTISELHIAKAQMTLGDTEPLESEPLALNDTFLLEPNPVEVPFVLNPLVVNDNLSSASKPMELMEIYDTISELHIAEAQMTLGETEPLESEPLALNNTILLEPKPAEVPLVLNGNLSSASKPMDLMEVFDTISELHTLEAQLTLGYTEVSKSQPLALNDTILLEPKPAEVPLVLNDNLSSASSASKPMELMEIYDTISELHIAEAQMNLGETEPLESEPLALNNTILLEPKPAEVPLVLNGNLSSASKPMDLMEVFDTISELHTLEAQLTLGDTEVSKSQPLALNDTILLEPTPAEVPLVLNDNLSSASKPMDLMEVFDTISELHTLKARLTLGVTEPTKLIPLSLNDTILLDAKPDEVTLVSDPLVNDNLSSALKPMDLMEVFDKISELYTVKAQMTLGNTELSKSQPLTLNDTILLDAKPVAVPLVSNPLGLNDNLSSTSKPMDLMEIFDTISELHTLKARLTLGEVSSTAPNSEAILKCRRNLMTLKHLKYPMSGTLAQKYLKTLKELTDKSGTDVTIHFNRKS